MIFSIDTLNQIITAMIPLGLLVTGVTNVLKEAFYIPVRFVPLVAVLLGAVCGLLVVESHLFGALAGIVTGLSSVGMWEVGKKSFKR